MTQAHPRRRLSIFLALVTMLTVLVGPSGPAFAIDINVDCDGGGVLQTAIDSASPGDRILVTGTCTENLVITTGGTNLTIEGVGAGVTFIDGDGLDTTVDIGTLPILEFKALTITGGAATGIEGGGIRNGGTLTLTNVDVVGNTTDTNGGGVFNGGTLTVNGGKINSNTAGADGGGVYNNIASSALFDGAAEIGGLGVGNDATRNGGGIYNNGTLTLQNDTHLVDNMAGDSGGGIYNTAGVLTMAFALVSGNTAIAAGGGVYSVNGSLIDMVGSSVGANTAPAAGGILNADPTSSAFIGDSFVNGNSATNPLGTGGGGIENANGATMTIDNVDINGNTAAGTGGAGIHNVDSTLTITDSRIIANVATATGGGIRTSGALTIDDLTLIQANQATAGGGIYLAGLASTVDILDSRVEDNDALSGGGAGIHVDPNNFLTLTNSSVTGNNAILGGGGISNVDGDVTLTNSTVSTNTSGTNGGGLSNNGLAGTITSVYSTIANNSASISGGGFTTSGPLVLEGTIVESNSAPSGADCSGTITSLGYNLVGIHAPPCVYTLDATDLAPLSDPVLGALTLGAISQFHPLGLGSAAIDAGGSCLLTEDQNGTARPDGPACDIGSTEGLSTVLPDEVVLVEPGGRWHIRVPGNDDYTFFYGDPGDIPLFGDWDGDGFDTPGMWRQGPGGGFAYLTNTLPPDGGSAIAEFDFFFGDPGDEVFSGDWNGDDIDTLGINRGGHIFLTDTNGSGGLPVPTDYDFWFGDPGDRAFGGDGDGNGSDAVFVYRDTTGLVYWTDATPVGPGAVAPTTDDFFFGDPADSFVAGDWNADLVDTASIFRDSDTTVYWTNTNASGGAPAPTDGSYLWGTAGWTPVAGVPELP